MAADRISSFTSEKARLRFEQAYADMRQRRLPADVATVDAHTSFGLTRTYTTGGDGVPFVLLPGAGGSVLSWHAYLHRLRAARPVIAIDPVGEPGCSVQDAGHDLPVRCVDLVVDRTIGFADATEARA